MPWLALANGKNSVCFGTELARISELNEYGNKSINKRIVFTEDRKYKEFIMSVVLNLLLIYS